MPRALCVGNGNILVNLDSHLQIKDFYYPFVGQQNHVGGHVHRWGVYIDNKMIWSTDHGWKTSLKYKQRTLVTDVKMVHAEAKIEVRINDMVHYDSNVFIRRFEVHNKSTRSRDARLMFHQDFHLYQDEVGDTVCFVPKRNVLVHYKRKRYMLMGGMTEEGHGMKQYTTGQKSWDHKNGTWHDAEDGELGMHPIAQGSVDSTASFEMHLAPQGVKSMYYWILAGKHFTDVFHRHDELLAHTPQRYIKDTENYWNSWVTKQEFDFVDLEPDLVNLFNQSLLIVRAQTDNRGAITAANDSDNLHYNKDSYSYMWPRDGALVSYALDRAGYHEITRKFFRFCEGVMSKSGYLLHKFNPDGSLGSSWHPWVIGGKPADPIQEDETALVLYALWRHYEITKDIEFVKPFYEDMIVKMGDFLARYRDPITHLPVPSYDLWEEQHGIFTFTTATVVAALKAAHGFAKVFGDEKRAELYIRASEETREAMIKYLYDTKHGRFAKKAVLVDGKIERDLSIDSSMFAIFAFDVLPVDDPHVSHSMDAIKNQLAVDGGFARYENDFYHRKEGYEGPGNPWIICTLWVADWYIKKATTHAELVSALKLFRWVKDHANEAGILPEQVEPHSGKPLSVAPLTWSHSSYVMSVLNYIDKYNELSESIKNGEE